MPAPRPLTLCPPAQLDWSRPGTPAAPEFGDIYFSTDGGLEETRTVFLKGCGLPERWQGTERFVIGELGFGSGLNFLAAWQMWDQTKPENGHLHFVSIEKFPFDKTQLSKALSAWPELEDYSTQLINDWPGRVKGFHRIHFNDVTLTLIHDDIESALSEAVLKADAWFLDGFSPAKNPDMWSAVIMHRLAELSADGVRLATFTVAGSVRQTLTSAGFKVERKEGFGRKRHRLEACYDDTQKSFFYSNKKSPVIIGAGVGGLSLAKAFIRRGLKPTLIEDDTHIAASGNAAAMVKPRLDLQDRPESRFFLGSYLYALKAYKSAVLSEGIMQIPKLESDVTRHKKILKQAPLPETHIIDGKENCLLFPLALVIDPLQFKKNISDTVNIEVKQLENLPAFGKELFIAAGFGIRTLIPDWPLRFSRGQITWRGSVEGLTDSLSYGGYGISLNEGTLIGATHDRLVEDENPFAIKPSDDEKNIEAFERYAHLKTSSSNNPSRASIRVTSADTLPVIGQTKEGHFVLTGLGSRGFVFAPLLAEAIVSNYYGDPMPVAASVWKRFSVERLFPHQP